MCPPTLMCTAGTFDRGKVKAAIRTIATLAGAGAAFALALPLAATANSTSTEVIDTVIGDGGTTQLDYPRSMVPAPGGGYLVVDTMNSRIQKVDTDGSMTTVAGTGWAGYDGDNQDAVDASLNEPRGVAVKPDGSIVVADTENMRVREIGTDGKISTIAGDGNEGQGLLGSLLEALLGTVLGTDTQLDHPSAVAVAADGSVLIVDTENNTIRRVAPDGQLSTAAGDGTGGYAGDGSDAKSAQLCSPEDVAALSDGSFLIADTGNNVVRKVKPDGKITTVAGDGAAGYSGDGGNAKQAELSAPAGVEVNPDGSFLIADTGNNVVRKVKTNRISTTIGNGADDFTGDGGDPVDASLSGPKDVLASNGVTLVADSGNNRIRKVFTVSIPDDDQGGNDDQGSDGGSAGAAPGPAAPTSLGSGSGPLPPVNAPTLAEDFQLYHQSGTVKVKLPGSGVYVRLDGSASIPVGSVVDTRSGTATLTSAHDGAGETQSAAFHGAVFKVTQKKAKNPITDLTLRGGDFSSCPTTARKAGPAMAARSSRRSRRHLWGSGHGRFRTIGRHGAATVRGTIWMTADRCDGTLVRVRRGRVEVRDFRARKTVFVRAGHSYFARKHARHHLRR